MSWLKEFLGMKETPQKQTCFILADNVLNQLQINTNRLDSLSNRIEQLTSKMNEGINQ